MGSGESNKKIDWMENDALFLQELAKGHRFERLVAQRLIEKGFTVQIPPKSIRDNVTEIHKYKNEVDLYVGRWGKPPAKIEIKSRDLYFTSPDDVQEWCMPLFVMRKEKWDQAPTKPAAILVVSQQTGAIIATSSVWQHKWHVTRTLDSVRKIPVTNYAADRELWHTFEDFCAVLEAKFMTRGE